MSKKRKKNYIIGVCPECKVREGDTSKKKLYKCPYCGRYFCEKHLEPRLTIMRDAIEKIQDPDLRAKVYEEWRKPGGHPDWIWTRMYFEDLKWKEEERRTKVFEILDKLKSKKRKEEKKKVLPTTQTKKKLPKEPEQKPIFSIKKPSLINRLKHFFSPLLKDLSWRVRYSMYSTIRNFLIFFTALCVLHFIFFQNINFLSVFYRSIILTIICQIILFIYRKTKWTIPYKWLIICGIIVGTLYFYSTKDFSKIKIIDEIVGIENFTDSFIHKISEISPSLYEGVKALLNQSSEPSYVKFCKSRLREELENLRLQLTVDISYRILEIEEFANPYSAENFAKNKVTTWLVDYKICEDEKTNWRKSGFPKIIAIIFEVRLTNPTQICISGSCATIEKFTGVFYCSSDKKVLKTCAY